MLTLGEYHDFKIDRDTAPGLFLKHESGDEILLPNKYKPDQFNIGDDIRAFVYLDHEERPVATTLTPKVKLDEFEMLECVDINNHGAFMDWGLEKHLFVPFAEQAYKMEIGKKYLIFCYLDELSERLVASSKVNHFVDNTILTVKEFDEVNLIVTNKTELGYNMIINDIHLGLLYFDEVFINYQTGDRIKGYIKKIRTDHKIDLTLSKFGYKSIEPNGQKILEVLHQNNGFLPFHDKSDPKSIYDKFKMSKKAFKKAIGTLYKDKKIEIVKNQGIKILE